MRTRFLFLCLLLVLGAPALAHAQHLVTAYNTPVSDTASTQRRPREALPSIEIDNDAQMPAAAAVPVKALSPGAQVRMSAPQLATPVVAVPKCRPARRASLSAAPGSLHKRSTCSTT